MSDPAEWRTAVPLLEIPRHPLWILAYDGAWETWFRQYESLSAQQPEAYAAALYVRYAHDLRPLGALLAACREAAEPSPLLAWLEWALYQHSGDRSRLADAFAALSDLYERQQTKRRPDGLFFRSAPDPASPREAHGWVDVTAQMALAAESLAAMARALERVEQATRFAAEHAGLCDLLNRLCWDDSAAFYLDRRADGSPAPVRTSAGFWALPAGAPDAARSTRLASLLADPRAFWRVHAFPCLSADHPRYAERGAYLRGSVWPLSNYAVIHGLERCGQLPLAERAADNHVTTISHVFKETRTHWENYMPDYIEPGSIAQPDYAPTAGIASVALLLETIVGLRVDAPGGALHWSPRLREAHSVRQLRIGGADVGLHVEPAAGNPAPLDAVLHTTSPVHVCVDLPGGVRRLLLRDEVRLRV